MHDKSHEVSGESRREFLKRAGAVAWVVPTMQIVNMAAASADDHYGQTGGSIVTTTKPTSTTKPPCRECKEWKKCRVKADWDGGWHWDSGVGRNDCIQDGDWEKCDGDMDGLEISGDARGAKVGVPEGCKITMAKWKAGRECHTAEITNGGRVAVFDPGDGKDISHVELVIECCVEWGPCDD